MRLRRIGLAVVAFVIWAVATFGIAYGVVEWRKPTEPDFFCRQAVQAFYSGLNRQGITEAQLKYLYNNQVHECGQGEEVP